MRPCKEQSAGIRPCRDAGGCVCARARPWSSAAIPTLGNYRGRGRGSSNAKNREHLPPSPPPPSAPPAPQLRARGPSRAAARFLGSCGRGGGGGGSGDVEPRAAAAIFPIAGTGPGPWTSGGRPSSGTSCSRGCGQSAPSSALTTSTAATGY